MDTQALLGLSTLMSFVAFGMVAGIYVWPRLRNVPREHALLPLVLPHAFRFVGLSFLIPGVASPALPSAFALPAAYGDLIAALLAIIVAAGLVKRKSWATVVAWPFNIWGAADFLHAFYQGQFGARVDPGLFGAAFFIPTLVVPPLFIAHVLIFRILLRGSSAPASAARRSEP